MHHRYSGHTQVQAQIVGGTLTHTLVVVGDGIIVVAVVKIDVAHGIDGGRGGEGVAVAHTVVVADIQGGVSTCRVVGGVTYHPLVGTGVVLKAPVGGFGGTLEVANKRQDGRGHIQRGRGIGHAPLAGLASAIGLREEGVGGVGGEAGDHERIGTGDRGDHRGGVARLVVLDVPLALSAGGGPLQGDAVVGGIDATQVGRTRTRRQRSDAYIIYIYDVG